MIWNKLFAQSIADRFTIWAERYLFVAAIWCAPLANVFIKVTLPMKLIEKDELHRVIMVIEPVTIHSTTVP